jgi:hypothetical protein
LVYNLQAICSQSKLKQKNWPRFYSQLLLFVLRCIEWVRLVYPKFLTMLVSYLYSFSRKCFPEKLYHGVLLESKSSIHAISLYYDGQYVQVIEMDPCLLSN